MVDYLHFGTASLILIAEDFHNLRARSLFNLWLQFSRRCNKLLSLDIRWNDLLFLTGGAGTLRQSFFLPLSLGNSRRQDRMLRIQTGLKSLRRRSQIRCDMSIGLSGCFDRASSRSFGEKRLLLLLRDRLCIHYTLIELKFNASFELQLEVVLSAGARTLVAAPALAVVTHAATSRRAVRWLVVTLTESLLPLCGLLHQGSFQINGDFFGTVTTDLSFMLLLSLMCFLPRLDRNAADAIDILQLIQVILDHLLLFFNICLQGDLCLFDLLLFNGELQLRITFFEL